VRPSRSARSGARKRCDRRAKGDGDADDDEKSPGTPHHANQASLGRHGLTGAEIKVTEVARIERHAASSKLKRFIALAPDN